MTRRNIGLNAHFDKYSGAYVGFKSENVTVLQQSPQLQGTQQGSTSRLDCIIGKLITETYLQGRWSQERRTYIKPWDNIAPTPFKVPDSRLAYLSLFL